jgi:hypothetical protein
MNKKIRFPPNCKTTQINNDYGDIVIKKPIVPTEFEIQLDLYLSLGAIWKSKRLLIR